MKPDDYEQRYMDAADALVRSRARVPGWVHAGFLIPALFSIYVAVRVAGLSTPLAVLELGIGAVLLVGWLMNTHVRVTVTPRHIHVQHGLFGPRIAIEDVVEVGVERQRATNWLKYVLWGLGGWGVDGSYAYTVPGVPHHVAIRFRRKGKVRKALVSSDDPQALVLAIEQATARVRVAEAVEAPAEHGEEPEEAETSAPARRARPD